MRIAYLLGMFMVFLGTAISVNAQTCNGSLGDPVINIGFGSGANPGPPLNTGVTTYTYFNLDCPQDGFYSIRNSTYACNAATWHDVPEDHTPGDVNGYMLVVNASYSPGIFFTQDIQGLCAGTTYEFACWVLNVLKPTACLPDPRQPNLKFIIESLSGTVLSSYSTGNIPTTNVPTWKQFALLFETPAGISDVRLKIVNDNPGGCGNDLLIDDITFRACAPKTTLSFVNATTDKLLVCSGNNSPIAMQANLESAFDNPVLQWQQSRDDGITWSDIAGQTTLRLNVTENTAGTFGYRFIAAEAGNLQNPTCRVVSNVVRIEVSDPQPASINMPAKICEGETVSISAGGHGAISWSGPNGFNSTADAPAFTAMANSGGTYNITRIDEYGCQSVASADLVVHAKPVLIATAAKNAVCRNDQIQLTASGAAQYLWTSGLQTVGNQASLTMPAPVSGNSAEFKVKGTSAEGCTDSTSLTIDLIDLPEVDAGPDMYVFEGDSTRLQGRVSDGDPFIWTPAFAMNDPLAIQPNVAPTEDMTYLLTAESAHGCGMVSDQARVFIYKNVQMPNAFSPNGDGINDTWIIRALASYPRCRVNIFDRYGKIVFQTSGYSQPWDGTWRGHMVPAGVYYYIIDLGVANKKLQGSVTVIR